MVDQQPVEPDRMTETQGDGRSEQPKQNRTWRDIYGRQYQRSYRHPEHPERARRRPEHLAHSSVAMWGRDHTGGRQTGH